MCTVNTVLFTWAYMGQPFCWGVILRIRPMKTRWLTISSQAYANPGAWDILLLINAYSTFSKKLKKKQHTLMLTRVDVKKSLVKEYHVFKSKIISKMLLKRSMWMKINCTSGKNSGSYKILNATSYYFYLRWPKNVEHVAVCGQHLSRKNYETPTDGW